MDTNSLLDKLRKGEVKLYELDEYDNAQTVRAKYIEQKLGIKLSSIKSSILKKDETMPNIENMIGSIQVPLGIAGPVKLYGEYAKGEFFLPLSTTEGALVASVNRGCSVINKSGGSQVVILKNQQSRSILFKTESIEISKRLSEYVKKNFLKLKEVGQEDERFIEILDIDVYIVGLNVWLRIKADTKDAMGMNMVTIAGKKISDYISKDFEGVTFISETGNFCVDKKPSAINLIESRGKRVSAEVNITEQIIKNVLKTTVDELVELNYRKNLLGSAASGSLGFNAHFANIIAAMFIATGQDVAHTVDGSLGFTTVEKTISGVNFCVTLTDLQVGTVGGGTGLPTQKECLEILGCFGPGRPSGNNSKKLAEIIACGVLAGEISLLGALCSKDLAKAHKNLNR